MHFYSAPAPCGEEEIREGLQEEAEEEHERAGAREEEQVPGNWGVIENFDNMSLTPGIEDPHFPNLFGDLQKYEEEQRKKELEEQLALDDESEEEEGGKGPKGRG